MLPEVSGSDLIRVHDNDLEQLFPTDGQELEGVKRGRWRPLTLRSPSQRASRPRLDYSHPDLTYFDVLQHIFELSLLLFRGTSEKPELKHTGLVFIDLKAGGNELAPSPFLALIDCCKCFGVKPRGFGSTLWLEQYLGAWLIKPLIAWQNK